MPRHEEEAAIRADAYIDALLARPRVVLVEPPADPDAAARRAAELLSQLPRFHPPFAFEEALAERLRQMAGGPTGRLAEVIAFPAAARLPGVIRATPALSAIDRRLLVGGAIASGVSVAAIYAWWQAGRHRGRSEVVA